LENKMNSAVARREEKTPASAAVPFFRQAIGEEEISLVADVLRSGWLTTGPMVQRFEREFAAAVKAEHAVALNSCTAALHLAAKTPRR
jgi:perosamine synthetase